MKRLLAPLLVISFAGCSADPAPPVPDTGARVRHWIEALREPDVKLRKEAAFKLGNLGPTDPTAVVPALAAALKDADPQVRCEAILALVKCGPQARAAIPELSEIRQNDSDARVREYASKALEKLQGAS